MKTTTLKRKIRRVLKEAGFADVKLTASDSHDDYLHLYIISPKFAGMRLSKIGEIIWSILFRELTPEEWGRITLTQGLTPEEYDGALQRGYL
jgi:hypothetical protein